MALDTLVDGTQLDADLTTVANAIRTKVTTKNGIMRILVIKELMQ